MRSRLALAAAALTFCPFTDSSSLAQIDPHGGMLRYPDVSGTHIAFVYANDIWIVPRAGGMAQPLASPPGAEMMPKFSPDGQNVAFIGNYEGNADVYVMPVSGGVATRLTHHPAGEMITDWSQQSGIIFYSNAQAGLGRQQLIYTIGPEGGMANALPIPYGAAGAISADGTWLAYTPFNADFRTWKRYRGGLASDIWLFNLKDNSAKKMTDWEGTDTIPMWHGGIVYHLSDAGAEHRLNIWSYDTASSARVQVTTLADYDIKWPSIGPGPNGQGEIVFQYGDKLMLLDLATKAMSEVTVTIPGDRPTIRARSIETGDDVQSAGISSTGKRAVVIARGDLWTAPAENGVARNLSNTDGAFERDGSWSPDGKWIAYFSDASGEYALYITQSDGKGETKQLTSGSQTFYYNPIWSPDSKKIFYTDKAGKKYLCFVETGEIRQFDADPLAANPSANWSHDSRWLAYSKNPDHLGPSFIALYDVENNAVHQATSGMFADQSPAFDRKGDFMYFASSRSFAPTYSDIDTTFIYDDSNVLIAVPLRADVKNPFAPKNDEEEIKEEKPEEEDAEEGAEEGDEGEGDDDAAEEGDEGDDDEGDDDDEQDEPAAEDDGVSGTWTLTLTAAQIPPGTTITMTLSMAEDHTVTGSISSPMGIASLTGNYNPTTGELTATVTPDDGPVITLNAKITDGTMTGTVAGEGFAGEFTGTRTAGPGTGDGDDEGDGEKDKPAEKVEIELDGFEQRAIQLPVPAGSFGALAVNNQNQLIYGRGSTRGQGGAPSIKMFDINADEKTEKEVATGAANFDMSADGKKILIARGNALTIQNAAPGGSPTNVSLAAVKAVIDPRAEWKQIFVEAWRLQRDFFYDPTLHGVDWNKVRQLYEPMIDDAISREDVGFVISEMISELNVGHAYYFGGDVEQGPSENVGMLGVDFAVENGRYRIAKIIEGAAWDVDARNPIRESGADVKAGDYLLKVNGVEVTIDRDPWAPFVGLANQTVILTVSEDAEINDNDREVLVKTIASEGNLRFRAWIENNRRYVAEKSGGKIGYVYVPDTGVNGQTNLVRQFYGHAHSPALIIDERWNGGGQIPTRFIEILKRPAVNYWARRDMKDWMWPPDSHQGPKCMLINGPAGSGGDAFPYYFKQAGIGPLIGARTWGGLVGISGAPGLIDGANVTVPTFAFYEMDSTWGIEGHGVDPDIPVVDDPSKMVNGVGDPQLDKAIEVMLQALETNPYVPPTRPAYPQRAGMGVTEQDK